MNRDRNQRVVFEALLREYGQEERFWLALALEDLDPLTQAFVRRCADEDVALRVDLLSIEAVIQEPGGPRYSAQAAAAEIRTALEISDYLVEGEHPRRALLLERDGDDSVTDIVLSESGAEGVREEALTDLVLDQPGAPPRQTVPASEPAIRSHVRSGLGALLDQLDIPFPSREQDERQLLCLILEDIVSWEAVNRFRGLVDWAGKVRSCTANHPLVARERVLRWLVPALFDDRHHLSFRLYLRSRLKACLKRLGLRPRGQKFTDLSIAIDSLSRDQMGVLLRDSLEELKREGTEMAVQLRQYSRYDGSPVLAVAFTS